MAREFESSLNNYRSKENFVQLIGAIKAQRDYDKKFTKRLSEVFRGSELPVYDNSELENALIRSLQQEYDSVNEEGFCEIEYFINELDFGRRLLDSGVSGKGIVRTVEELWDLLMVKYLVQDAKRMLYDLDKEENASISFIPDFDVRLGEDE